MTRVELSDVDAGPEETIDLAGVHPGVFQEMVELWRSERRRLGITLPAEIAPATRTP